MPVNKSTRICSDHFLNTAGCRLHPDEFPSQKLPVLSTTICVQLRKPPKERSKTNNLGPVTSDDEDKITRNIGVNTDLNWNAEVSSLKGRLKLVEEENMFTEKTGRNT